MDEAVDVAVVVIEDDADELPVLLTVEDGVEVAVDVPVLDTDVEAVELIDVVIDELIELDAVELTVDVNVCDSEVVAELDIELVAVVEAVEVADDVALVDTVDDGVELFVVDAVLDTVLIAQS